MTAHEYLNQVYYLNRKIKYDLASLEELRELSCSIGSPSWVKKWTALVTMMLPS